MLNPWKIWTMIGTLFFGPFLGIVAGLVFVFNGHFIAGLAFILPSIVLAGYLLCRHDPADCQAKRRRGLQTLVRRPDVDLQREIEGIAPGAGVDVSDIDRLWRAFALYYCIPPQKILASDTFEAELMDAMTDLDNDAFFCGAFVVLPRPATESVDHASNWGELMIALCRLEREYDTRFTKETIHNGQRWTEWVGEDEPGRQKHRQPSGR